MKHQITKYQRSSDERYDFSLLIPTWNNLPFIQNCLQSIEKNSTQKIQIIVIVNEGIDGTYAWFTEQNKYDFIYSKENIGICYAVNICRSLILSDYIVYANDDMYFLPDWDKILHEEIQKTEHNNFMFSVTMIEPEDTGNPCVSVGYYGKTLDDFQEQKLLSEYKNHIKKDWNGSTWPPLVVHKDIWDLVGGFSIEFSPGMYSDPDFSMKLYQLGIRHYKGVGASLVYHFGSKSTKRLNKNKGRNIFLMKWGITAGYFYKYYLNMGIDFTSPLPDQTDKIIFNLINRLKRIIGSYKSKP